MDKNSFRNRAVSGAEAVARTATSMASNRMVKAEWRVLSKTPVDFDPQGDSLRVTTKSLNIVRPDAVVLTGKGEGSLIPGVPYVLSLLASANPARLVGVLLLDDRRRVLSSARFHADTKVKKKSLKLVISPGKPARNFEMAFLLGGEKGTIELSDIDLR